MKYHQYYILFLFFVLGVTLHSCDEPEVSTDEYLKVYLNSNSLDNVQALDVVSLIDGYLIIGLCNADQMINSKIESGTLFFLKTNLDGELLWEKCYDNELESGVPSNFLVTADNSVIWFWNDLSNLTTQLVMIDLANINSPPTLQVSTAGCTESCATLMYLNHDFANTGYIALGILADSLENESFNVQVNRFDNDFTAVENVSNKLFRASSFTSQGTDISSILRNIHGSLFISLKDNGYFFNSPINDRMSLGRVGEIQPIYSDRINWITAFTDSGPNTASLVVSSPLAQDFNSTLFPNLQLNEGGKNFEEILIEGNGKRLQEIDPNKPIIILQLSTNPTRLLVVGTNRTQRVVYYLYDSRSDKISARKVFGSEETTFPIGNAYSVATAIEDEAGNVIINGSVIVNGIIQRPFMIKVDQKDLD